MFSFILLSAHASAASAVAAFAALAAFAVAASAALAVSAAPAAAGEFFFLNYFFGASLKLARSLVARLRRE